MPRVETFVIKKDIGLLDSEKTYKSVRVGLQHQIFDVDSKKLDYDLCIHHTQYEKLLEDGFIQLVEKIPDDSYPYQLPPDKIELRKLKELLNNYINYLASPEYHEDNDWETWIYEQALITFYGESIFDWINNQHK
jgi:hypothetical protein